MVEMAQGNVPFYEKNLNEIIRRNVRCGRLVYSTDIEAFARKSQFIFLAEDTPRASGGYRGAHCPPGREAAHTVDHHPGVGWHREARSRSG